MVRSSVAAAEGRLPAAPPVPGRGGSDRRLRGPVPPARPARHAPAPGPRGAAQPPRAAPPSPSVVIARHRGRRYVAAVDPRDVLPHRPPFLLVDEIDDVTPGESATGRWRLTGEEAFFAGHFP